MRDLLLRVLLPSEALLLVLAVGVSFAFHRPTQSAQDIRDQVAQRARVLLESSPVIADLGLAAHLHDTNSPKQVRCAVDPIGTDPATVTSADQVHVLYALHVCAIGAAGIPWEAAPKSAGPVVVNLDDGSVWVPQPGRDYRTQVAEKVPQRYLAEAFGTFAHPEAVAQVRQRYTDEVENAD